MIAHLVLRVFVAVLVVLAAVVPVAARDALAAGSATIVFDSWWNYDFAKQPCKSTEELADDKALIAKIGCVAVTSCPELGKIAAACIGNIVSKVRQFEDEVMTELAANPYCNGVIVTRYEGPKVPASDETTALIQQPHWSFSLNCPRRRASGMEHPG